MQPYKIMLLLALCLVNIQAHACTPTPPVPTKGCCQTKGGIHYCDGSAGRYVCGDGDYSSCYCNRHAVMELDKIQGCCLWQGGVFKTDEASGTIICNNGGVSLMCGLQIHPGSADAVW
jgi:hypothetical protein